MELSHARILIIRLSSIGDVLHATPVARNMRRALPHARIAWLASPPAADLLTHFSDIDELIVWDRRPFDRAVAAGNILAGLRFLREAKRLLAPHRFDIVLDVQDLFLTGILARLTGARMRIGIRERSEGGGFFMTMKAPRTEEPHKVRRYLSVLAPLGLAHDDTRISLDLPQELAGFASSFWARHGIDAQCPILLVSLRTTWKSKEWPPENFAAALREVPEDVQIVFSGAKSDAPFIGTAQRELEKSRRGRSLSIAGETSLIETAALMREATLLFSPDTGPLHIAAAVGLPTLSLWGPTRPSIYGPLHGSNFFFETPYDCPPCCKTHCPHGTNACMAAIEPSAAARRLKEVLECLRK